MISISRVTGLLAIVSFYNCCHAWSSKHNIQMQKATIPSQSSLVLHMGGRTNKQRREDRNRYQKNNKMLDFIDKPVTSEELVGDLESISADPADDDLADLVNCVVRAADGRKADNIVAIRVSKVSTVTSFVVICTANSRPQNQAIAAIVQDEVQEQFGLLPGANGVPEGSADSGWTVLDYGSVMVHVMTPRSRLFYNVEGKWKDQGGEYMDISSAILPNTVEQGSTDDSEGTSTMEGISEEDDPFWS